MNGDKKRVYLQSEAKSNNNNMAFVHFRRKTESLDWKKIASVDVEKVIQSSNVDILDDLLPQVAYCRPESEFDSENANSSLLKVFKLSQLMIEYLLHCQEILQGQSEQASSQFTQVENQRVAYANEIQSLKENLAAAKRELKRRKEIIASAQNDVIGDNKDEFDPCPYCSKKFLTSAYLYSHMLRRHQGLPMQPVFPAQHLYQGLPPQFIDNNYQKQPQYIEQPPSQHSPRRKGSVNYIVHTTTESHEEVEEGRHQLATTDIEKLVNLETIGALVEEYLRQKGIKTQSILEITNDVTNKQRDQNVNTEIVNGIGMISRSSSTFPSPSKEDAKLDPQDTVNKISEQIKSQLDLQWKQLLEKIQESGLADIKSFITSEPGEIKSKSGTPSPTNLTPEKKNQNEKITNSESTLIIENHKKIVSSPIIAHQQLVEERFQQQQHELESLKSNLHSRMEKDMVTIESKLESQERYWRNKLRTQEQAYADQLSKLREEFQISLQKFVEKNSLESSPQMSNKNCTIETKQINENSIPEDSATFNNKYMKQSPPRIMMTVTVETPSREEQHVVESTEWSSTVAKICPETNNTNPSPKSSPIAQHVVPRIIVQKRNPSTNPLQMTTTLKPIAKPRKIPQTLVANDSPQDKQTKLAENVIQVQSKHHEYEEPDDILKLDEVTDYSNSGSLSEDVSSSAEDAKNSSDKSDRKTRGRHHYRHGEPKSKLMIRMMTEEEAAMEGRKVREKCEEDLSNELKSLGIDPEGTQGKEKATRKRQRESMPEANANEVNYNRVQEEIDNEAKTSSLSKSIKKFNDNSRYNSPKKGTKSPLVKILSAVKMSGNNWKRTVKSACKRPLKKERKQSLLRSPSKSGKSKPGIFSRERWRKNKEKDKNPSPLYNYTENKRESSVGENEDEPSSEVSASSEPEIEKTIFIAKTPIKKSRNVSSRKLSSDKGGVHDDVEVSTDSDESVDSDHDHHQKHGQSSSPHVKKRLKVKNNIASKLRYREGRRKNGTATATVPAVKDKSLQNNYAKFIASNLSGSTVPENAQLETTAQKFVEEKRKVSARRSLEAEFDKVTPRNEAKFKQQTMERQRGGESSTLSWDDDEDENEGMIHTTKKNPSAGEYVKLTPTKADKMLNNNYHGQMTMTKQSQSLITSQNPNVVFSAPRRLVMDSWDNDDEDEEEVRRDHFNIKKPMPLVSQRGWETRPPVYENTSDKRRPMSAVTNDNIMKPSTSQKPVSTKEPNPRNLSPLNNSWDSD